MELDVKEVEAIQALISKVNDEAAQELRDLQLVCLGGGLGETAL
jgi:hypothetical protein